MAAQPLQVSIRRQRGGGGHRRSFSLISRDLLLILLVTVIVILSRLFLVNMAISRDEQSFLKQIESSSESSVQFQKQSSENGDVAAADADSSSSTSGDEAYLNTPSADENEEKNVDENYFGVNEGQDDVESEDETSEDKVIEEDDDSEDEEEDNNINESQDEDDDNDESQDDENDVDEEEEDDDDDNENKDGEIQDDDDEEEDNDGDEIQDEETEEDNEESNFDENEDEEIEEEENEEEEEQDDTTEVISEEGNTKERHIPKIIWLMSYPNSGTSFTMNYVQSSSNKTVATNYGPESKQKTPDRPLQPVDPRQNKGPWILSPLLEVPDNYIMTKTHCGGYCIECGPERYMMTKSAFANKCAEVTRLDKGNGKGKWVRKVYGSNVVKKTIHLIRNPINNMVSNFHLQVKQNRNKRDWNYNNNKKGFQKWCRDIDATYKSEEKKVFPSDEYKSFRDVPCHGTFLKYVKWHNHAAQLVNDMNVPSIVMWYEDYETEFEASSDKLFDFLEATRIDHAYQFHPGKSYLNYFSKDDKKKIEHMIENMATPEVWELLKRYF